MYIQADISLTFLNGKIKTFGSTWLLYLMSGIKIACFTSARQPISYYLLNRYSVSEQATGIPTMAARLGPERMSLYIDVYSLL